MLSYVDTESCMVHLSKSTRHKVVHASMNADPSAQNQQPMIQIIQKVFVI